MTGENERLIEQVGQALKAARGYDSTVRIAATCTVPELADLVVVALQHDCVITDLEVAHGDPAFEPRIVQRLTPLLTAVCRAAARDWRKGRQFRWMPDVNYLSSRFLAEEPELLQLLAALDIRSLVVVPLRSGGRILGGIAFARTGDNARRFQASDLAVAQVISRRAATAIESAELLEQTVDETKRREGLEDALQKWIHVFDLAGWGAAIVDGADQRIDAVNPAFARMHGYESPDSLAGRLFSDVLAPGHSREPDRWLQGWEGQTEPYESAHVRADGIAFPVLTDVTPMSEDTTTTSYVVTIQDLTKLKRAEERLRRAQRMEAVGRLAGGVAHEVNNMMTIILGFSDLLTAAADLPESRQRDVDEIRKAAIRTGRVTQQLLAFSRQQVLQPADLQLDEIVAEMSSVLRHLLPANVSVETVVSPIPATVHADRAQIDQVLINLAFNARDAMPLGGTLRLATGSRYLTAADGLRLIGIPIPPGHYAVLSVSDTGHGMDQDTLSQVFEPFFTTKPVGSGTGLGLATVYGIVKQSGGLIWVESDPGTGTTFTVCLPQVPNRVAAPDAMESDERDEQRSGGATVLIVEDEDGVRELVRRVLEDEGYTVLDVKSGAEATGVLDSRGSELDLVLSDVVTPDMAAVEIEAQVRARRPELPILYMSGYSWDEIVGRGLVSSGQRFLQKPFTAAELADAVGQQLNTGTAVVGR